MIIKDTLSFGEILAYVNPGQTLNDIEFKHFHKHLTSINKLSGSNVTNKMLNNKLSLVELRQLYASGVYSVVYNHSEPIAFLMCPILQKENLTILHIGLMMIYKNPGGNLLGYLATKSTNIANQFFRIDYITTISSTPSVIECFCECVTNAWPSPNIGQKKAPRDYLVPLRVLSSQYMVKCFPDNNGMSIDEKRFILKSNSAEMGFKTNFYQISRAEKMKYNLFCRTWIDYDHEEDIIQVGKLNFFIKLRIKVINFILRFSMNKLKTHSNQNSQLNPASGSEIEQQVA